MLKIPTGGRLLKIFLITVFALDIALAACLLASPGRGSGSGIQVNVLADTASPAQADSGEGDGSRRVLIIVRDKESRQVVTTIVPDEDGLIRVHLVPGRYLLEVQSAEEGALLSGNAPDVEVQDGLYTAVTVRLERKQTGSAARWDAF